MTDLDTGSNESANDSLRAALESAFDAPAAPAETKEASTDSAPKDTPDDEAKAARDRDEKGRFAAKAEKAEAEKAVSDAKDATAETGKEAPATRKAPQSWSKEYYDHWNKLDPAIQDQILKREADVAKGFEERATKLKPYEELDRIFQPHRQRWQLKGWSEAQAVQQLLAAQDYLDRDPAAAIRWLANSYGLKPDQIVQTAAHQQQQADPLAQYLAPVMQELQQVKATLTAREQAEQTRQQNAIRTEIESFSKDHPHFETVKADMAALLHAGRAEHLQDAYEKATWAHPDVRRQIMDEQAKAQAAKNAEDVEKAKRAASSVTGAPTGKSATGPKQSLREELEAAFG
jgi:hypothetical protein